MILPPSRGVSFRGGDTGHRKGVYAEGLAAVSRKSTETVPDPEVPRPQLSPDASRYFESHDGPPPGRRFASNSSGPSGPSGVYPSSQSVKILAPTPTILNHCK